MGNILTYITGALGNFSAVRSILPTSSTAAKAITRSMIEHHRDMRNIVVEYGAGTGAITQEILRDGMLTKEGQLFIFELTEHYAKHLKNTISDTRAHLFHQDAISAPQVLKEHNIEYVDHVFSGLPFSKMKPEDVKAIITQTYDMLRPGGVFVAYQISDSVAKLLDDTFDHVSEKEVRSNILLYKVYVAWKEKKSSS